jgi:hypothetical protein
LLLLQPVAEPATFISPADELFIDAELDEFVAVELETPIDSVPEVPDVEFVEPIVADPEVAIEDEPEPAVDEVLLEALPVVEPTSVVAEAEPEDETEPEPEVPVFMSVLVTEAVEPFVPELPELAVLCVVLQFAIIMAIGNTSSTFFIVKKFNKY